MSNSNRSTSSSSARPAKSSSSPAPSSSATRAADNDATEPAAAGDVNRETSATSKDDVTGVDYPGLRGTGHDDDADKDRTIADLRKQLAAINAQPDGAATEMQKALAALTAEVERMKAGAGLVPVPEASDPDPYLYNVLLGCGDRVDGQHPHATHHFCEQGHGTQRVDKVFPKSPEQLAEQLA